MKKHVHRNIKHKPYGLKQDKRAYEWCAWDGCREYAVKDRGYVKQVNRKEIEQYMDDMRREQL